MKTPTLAMLCAALLAGCASAPIVTNFSAPAKGQPVTVSTVLSNVQCGDKLREHEITLRNMGTSLLYKNGSVFAQAFTGGADAPAKIELVTARVDQALTPSLVIDKTQLTYVVTVEVTSGGRKQVLTATGVGAALGPEPAMRQALQNVANDLAAQVRAAL
jgi:hypothetical protein